MSNSTCALQQEKEQLKEFQRRKPRSTQLKIPSYRTPGIIKPDLSNTKGSNSSKLFKILSPNAAAPSSESAGRVVHKIKLPALPLSNTSGEEIKENEANTEEQSRPLIDPASEYFYLSNTYKEKTQSTNFLNKVRTNHQHYVRGSQRNDVQQKTENCQPQMPLSSPPKIKKGHHVRGYTTHV